MEDYKQKLKDALDDKLVPIEVQEWIEENFPELVESEDERIMKAISQCVEDMRGQFEKLYRVHHKDAIAWLEKKAEQKHTAEEVLIKAGLKPYKDGDQWCVLLGDNIQEGICGFGNTIEDALYAFLKDLIASQGEQKTDWSEKDEELMKWSINNLTELKDRFGEEYGKVGDCINWLKSLKNKVYPKLNQGWSEDDETTFTVIGSLILDNFSAEDASKTLTWLHSLRPQKTWKPSDEMLEALYRVTPDNVKEKSEDEVLLDKLYQGLKYGRVLSKK